MAQYFSVHPDNPQQRLIGQAAAILRAGGVMVYPTDSSYALACAIGDKAALDRLRALRKLGPKHLFTLMCQNLSELGIYATVDDPAYRLMKTLTPGPYTFILRATREVPRRLLHDKRKTLGLRVPANAIAQALLAELGEPLISTSAILPEDSEPMTDARDIADALGNRVELVIDGGACGPSPTTVLNLNDGEMTVVRAGRGDISAFTAV